MDEWVSKRVNGLKNEWVCEKVGKYTIVKGRAWDS